MDAANRILGLDPGLVRTGWGVIATAGSRLRYIASGEVASGTGSLARRLAVLFRGLEEVIEDYRPDEVAVEESFVNRNPRSSLMLGHARAVALLAPGMAGIPIAEYAPTAVKLALVGKGRADKDQVAYMVRALLPESGLGSGHQADALAVAVCHASHVRGPLGALHGHRARRAVPTEEPR